MKRQSFMLASAGALLAGCASPSTSPSIVAESDSMHASGTPNDAGEQLLGSIMLAPYSKIPKDYERCHGQLINIAANTALFSLLYDRFGGNGKTNFALPDLSKHAPIDGLTYFIAYRGTYPNRKGLARNASYLPLIGAITCLAYEEKYVPPSGWARCNGQLVSIQKNALLYSLIGTQFGGDGAVNFGLPDLREHELGKGLTYVIATSGRYPNFQ